MKIPRSFLIAEDELEINVFIYNPTQRKIVPFRRMGAVLSLDDLLTLMSLSPSQVLMPRSEYNDALEKLLRSHPEE